MTDLSRSHGVDFTVVKNLTGESIVVSWFPGANGWGRIFGPNERVRFSGNLFEAVAGIPAYHDQMLSDVRTGKVSIAACGVSFDKYEVLNEQAVTLGCREWSYESSSSAWILG